MEIPMTRSRMRKLLREQAKRKRNVAAFGPLAAAMALATPARTQESPQQATPQAAPQPQQQGPLEEIVVTAQKRTENLQDVPLSITALGTQELENLRVEDFDDYAKFLPSLSYTTLGPGFSRVFFRGVSSGDNGNHSGPLPSVGQYLDEQPITTIQGALDIHLYDIERVEALAGPQGTLYGASSQSGTVRIITNKPQPGEFEASYDLEANVTGDEPGYVAEGMVNVPLFGEKAAIRLVGWAKHDGGYIDNVFGTRTFPTAGITVNNSSLVKDDYNDVDTYGARAALRIDLTDSWTVTPGFMGQLQKTNGGFAYEPSIGGRDVFRTRDERVRDGWYQAALTVEGTIANFDVTYAGSYLNRDDDVIAEYSDYSYFYDVLYYYTFTNDLGEIIDPTQRIEGKDRYKRHSHEIRIASPQDARFRFIGGFFFQRQQHRIEQRYLIDDMLADYEITGWADTIWLTEQKRVDRDYALFGEATADVTDKLSFTGGIRLFRARNSLEGFFGLNDSWSTSGTNGEALCSVQAGDPVGDESSWVPYESIGTAPCKNLDKIVEEDDYTPKVNLTYRFDDDRMAYFTWSKGFRPGGVNRRGTFPPYKSDFLTNYEVGFKTSWLDRSLRFNGAFFWQKWDDFQFSFLGENGLTNITNAGKARIWGLEGDFEWAPIDGLLINGGATYLDAELDNAFCQQLDANSNPLPPALCEPDDFAPKGSGLPQVPDYKLNMTARYSFDVREYGAFVQSSFVVQGDARSALLPVEESVFGGKLRAYGLWDASVGLTGERFRAELYVDNLLDKRADLARFTNCDSSICTRPYTITNTPRTVGIRFGQDF
jgi:outer membrane receptor protein involved in Fe transport